MTIADFFVDVWAHTKPEELFDYFGGRDAASDYLRRLFSESENTLAH